MSDPAPSAAARFARLRWLVRLYRHPSAALLIVQLAGLLLYPFIESKTTGTLVYGVVGVVVLVATMSMVHRTKGHVRPGLALAAAVVTLNVGTMRVPDLLPWAAAVEAVFSFYAAASLIRYMLADTRATTDEIFCAGATFTLLAWAFAHVFVVCQYVQPHSFGAAMNADAPRTWTELLFLSFVLLSSTGIGDVTPLVPFARALACLEIFTGVMYLALIVSRLIGLTLVDRDR